MNPLCAAMFQGHLAVHMECIRFGMAFDVIYVLFRSDHWRNAPCKNICSSRVVCKTPFNPVVCQCSSSLDVTRIHLVQ